MFRKKLVDEIYYDVLRVGKSTVNDWRQNRKAI